MYLQASQILGLPIVELETSSKIGEVAKIIIDPKLVKIAGFLVAQGSWWFTKKLLLSESDILDIDKYGIVTNSCENLIMPEEVFKINKILEKKISIFRQEARTKSGQYLGKISDFTIEEKSGYVAKFYIHGWLEEKIISREKLIKVTPKKIIFEDDVIEITQAIQTTEVAV